MLGSIDNKSLGERALPANDTIFDTLEAVDNIDLIWDTLFTYLGPINIDALSYYHLPPFGSHDFDDNYFVCRGRKTAKILNQKSVIFETDRSFLHKIRKIDQCLTFKEFSTPDVLTEEQSQLFKDIHLESSETGLIVSVHGSNGRSGCFVFETFDFSESLNPSMIRELRWVCQTAHRTYSRLRKKHSKSIKQLTSREQQILTWVARGKSNSVIADIIGISQHTVNGYLRSIYLKTGTSDRTTAALRGIGDALIDL